MKLAPKKGMCFLVSNEYRDYYLLIGIIYYLEKFENYQIEFEFIWDAHKIKIQKPDLVIVPNTRGHNLYYEVGKYCFENSISLISHESEGNFNESETYNYWAYNSLKTNFSAPIFVWNERKKIYLIDEFQIDEEKIKVTGAPIFDKYIYLKKKSRNEILTKYKKQEFTKITGYAGWAFGKIFNKEINDVLFYLEKEREEGIKWLEEQRDFVQDCLESVIQKHPDILFILKKHPRENFESDLRDSRNEMNQLKHYHNVLYLKDEEEIQDLIAISDLWMAFESTSIMEAWLLGIPTLMINKTSDFKRVDLHEGSKKATSKEEMLTIFDAFFETNKDQMIFFPENIISKRKAILKNAIGFADGLNHLRTANFIKNRAQSADSSDLKIRTNWKFLRLYYLLHIGKYFYNKRIFQKLPKFNKTVWVFENRKLSNLKIQKSNTYKELDHFYENLNLNNLIQTNQLWSRFNEEK